MMTGEFDILFYFSIGKKKNVMLQNSMISTLKIYVYVIWKDYHPHANNYLLRMGLRVIFIFIFILTCISSCHNKHALLLSLEEIT